MYLLYSIAIPQYFKKNLYEVLPVIPEAMTKFFGIYALCINDQILLIVESKFCDFNFQILSGISIYTFFY